MLTKIEATQDDIDGSECGSAYFCMIAKAINRKLAEGFWCRVLPSRNPDSRPALFIIMSKAADHHRGVLPHDANEMAMAFDSARVYARPIAFNLDIPAVFLKEQPVADQA